MRKILTVVAIALIIVLLLVPPFIVKARVECTSQFGTCPEEVLTKLENFSGKSLFSADRDIKKYLKSQFLISDFSLQFKLPNILKVDLIVKKPAFALQNGSTAKFYLISSDASVLSIANSSTLPTLQTNVSLKVGQKIEAKYLFALQLLNGVFEMYQLGNGTINNSSLLVDLPGQIRVLFPLEGDTQVLLGALRIIYTKITTGDLVGKYKVIDLRFKNPVLR